MQQPQVPTPYGPSPARRPTPQASAGVHWVVWLVAGGALLFAFAAGLVVVVWLVLAPVRRPVTYVTYGGGGYTVSPHGVRSGTVSGGSGGLGLSGGSGSSGPSVTDEGLQIDPGPKLPAVKRHVPLHPISLLDGCSRSDLDAVEDRIDGAIHVGAPMYNDGDFAGCYRTYESAAQSLEKTLPKSCTGPVTALRQGRDRAAKLSEPSEQAWAMRDAFDGLLDVIDRKGPDL